MISRRMGRTFAIALGLAAAVAAPVLAQGTITIAAGSAATANVAPGKDFVMPVVVDMSDAAGLNLAALTARVTWTAGRFTLDSIRGAGFGSVESTIGSGSASLAVFDANGLTTTTTVANLYFTAGANTVGSRIQITPTRAGNELGANITDRLHTRNYDVCVAPVIPWGDADGDGTVTIIDAQQIARFGVGLSVANPASLGAGDVDANGSVDIVDAMGIAQSVVGLSAPARIGTSASKVPEVAGVSIQPGTLDVGIAQIVQLLAVPEDANGAPLIGCTPIAWASTDAATATIDSAGRVTGVASGAATITATAVNGQSGALSLSVSTPVATLDMSIDTATIHLAEQLQLSATVHAAGGAPLSSPVTFSSSDSSIATVSATGQVTGVNVGPVKIIATAQGKTATADIQIAPLAEYSLATGDDFSCALTVTGSAYCWGSNAAFQLGDGTTTNRPAPVAVAVPASLRFTRIVAGVQGVCALATNQSVYCWGAKYPVGVLVNPTLVSDTVHVKALAVWGGSQDGGLCMLNLAGTAFCIGDGRRGQMGTGASGSSAADNTVPRPVLGNLQFQSISANQYAVCGLSSGTPYCWGSDQFQSLGRGTPPNTATPAPVANAPSFASVVVGAALTCGVTSGGAGYCWGSGFDGGDGRGTLNLPPTPTPTAIDQGALLFRTVWGQTGTRTVSASCGLTTDSLAYCWGSNSRGQLGTSATIPSGGCIGGPCTPSPTAVTTSAKFVTIRPGGEHACGITVDHRVLCWGSSSAGQIGDGFLLDRPTPAVVSGNLRVP